MLEEYATRVFREWALGQADRDNGVLLLVARDDRELRIEVGYGLEGDLTDARSSEIIRNVIVPRFRQGDFESGVVAGTEAILASVEGTYAPQRAAPDEVPLMVRLGFGLMFVVLPFAMLVAFLRTGYPGVLGTLGAGIAALFLSIFISLGFTFVFALPALMVLVAVIPIGAMALDVFLERHPTYGPTRRDRRRKREIIRAAQRRGATSVMIDGVRHSVPSRSSSSGSSGSFSGSGGSSGGGGASGSW